MFKKVFALGLVATASAAGAPASNNLRLRGGFAGSFAKLTEAPGVLDAAGTDNKVKIDTKAGGNVGVEASFVATAANAIKSALKATTSVQGVDLEIDLDDSGAAGIKANANNLVDGLKLQLDTAIASGSKIDNLSSPKVSAEYSHGAIGVNANSDGDISATYAVNDDIRAGISTNYDANGGSLGDINLAASYKAGATAVSAAINGLKGDNIALTASHKVDDSLDVAGTFSTHDSKFAVGAGYKIDGDSLVRVNANSDGHVNVGYERKISDSTSLNAGMQLDANDTGHRKIGVSMTCHV